MRGHANQTDIKDSFSIYHFIYFIFIILIDLILEIAKSLDYDFDRVQIRRVFYIPKGHSEIEQEQNALRKGLVDELLEGNRAVPMDVRSFPEMEQTPEVQATSSLIVELVEKERQRQLPPAGG